MSFDSLFFDEKTSDRKPINVDCTQVLIDGKLSAGKVSKVEDVTSPIRRANVAAGGDHTIVIGKYGFSTKETALEAVEAAFKAYDHGKGAWPRMAPRERIEIVAQFADELATKRDEIAEILMWEICKNKSAAYKEIDRTVDYVCDTIKELKQLENKMTPVMNEQGIVAQIKRSPLGVVLCAAPFNYPINETYTTLIPALIMGNTVVLKTPRIGGLCHVPTLALFAKLFPAGTINIVHGSGREVFGPIMATGKVNVLAFIGSSKAANALHQQHPRPFTVRLALGLDAKNPAIVTRNADLDVAATECTLGALSYCGQRCTAIKIIFVHESVADAFVAKVVAKVDALSIGLPWDGADITPLPEPDKPDVLKKMIADCEAKGAKVVNKRGGESDRSLFFPAVVYPCTLDMDATQQEQFGPLVPIVRYSDVAEVQEYMAQSEFGQQAAVFTTDQADLPPLVDFLAHQVTRININAQCQRGPDVMPFGGRKHSAVGTLSVHDALRVMSIRVAIATKSSDDNIDLVQAVLREGKSNILRADLLI